MTDDEIKAELAAKVAAWEGSDQLTSEFAEELFGIFQRHEAERLATLETALRTIQSAVPKYLKKEMTAEEFIDAVLAAADEQKVVRAVRASGASPER